MGLPGAGPRMATGPGVGCTGVHEGRKRAQSLKKKHPLIQHKRTFGFSETSIDSAESIDPSGFDPLDSAARKLQSDDPEFGQI